MTELIKIDDGLWHACSSLRSGGVGFPLRMTVMKTRSGLVLWSPIEIDESLAASLAELGPITALVAPNRYHHVHLNAAAERWPDAAVFGPQALADGGKHARMIALDEARSAWPEISLHPLLGAEKIQEWVAFHRPSASLITTDLLFNIKEAEGLFSRFVFRWIAKTLGKAQQSRLWKNFITDEALITDSLDQVLELPFSRIVMAHGDVLEAGTPELLRSACVCIG